MTYQYDRRRLHSSPPTSASTGAARRPARAAIGAALLGCLVTAGGACSSDILDVDVNLSRQSYSADFGTAQGTIPTVTCDPAQPDVCGASAGAVQVDGTSGAGATVQLGCDGASQRCFAEAHATITTPVDVLQDQDFVTKVERRSVVIVRALDIIYAVPVNSLTFDVPEILISVGPAGSTSAGDPGVVPVGTTSPLAAGVTLDDAAARHLVIADGSPARGFIESSIMNQQTLVFIATLSPRLEAGAAIPAGALQVDLLPRLTLGLPR
jgi:hypothetical protein